MNQKYQSIFLIVMMLFSVILPYGTLATDTTTGSYEDIKGHWAEKEIRELIKEGIVTGNMQNGKLVINPNLEITRAEFFTILIRSLKINIEEESIPNKSSFTDIANHWAKPHIEVAKKRKITNGYQDGTFKPNQNINRAEAVTALVRAYNIEGPVKANVGFKDITMKHWAYPNILLAVEHGLVNGYSDNTFKPENKIKRAESFALIYRIITKDTPKDEKVEEKKEQNPDVPSTPIDSDGENRDTRNSGNSVEIGNSGNLTISGQWVYDSKNDTLGWELNWGQESQHMIRSFSTSSQSTTYNVYRSFTNEEDSFELIASGVKDTSYLDTDFNHVEKTFYYVSLFGSETNKSNLIFADVSLDTDDDGLPNILETIYGTNPNNPDTDGDGLTDYEEIVITQTDPLKKDTDGNGILDPDEDFDNDGLTNIEEIRLNSDPYNEDTDFDGLLDEEEKNLGTKLDEWDTDGDGLSDSKEIELGTDPLNMDTNGNGILDGDEIHRVVKTPNIENIDPNVIPSVAIDLTANLIDSLEISALPEDDLYLPSEMPGYIGAGYEFELGGEFEEATLTFTFNPDFLDIEDFEPAIYYYDEEAQDMILLDNQVIDWENHKVSAKVEHFSKYILINNTKYLEVWEEEIKIPSVEDLNKPLDIVLVIDSSGSMGRNDPYNIRISTAKEFVNRLKDDTRVSVVDFDSYAYLLSSFTTDKDAVKKALDRIDSSGGTSLTAGIRMALDQFTSGERSINTFELLDSSFEGNEEYEEYGENGLDIYGNSLLPTDKNIELKDGKDEFIEYEEADYMEEIENPELTYEFRKLQTKNLLDIGNRDPLKFLIMLTDGEGSYDKNLTQRAIDNEVTIYTVGLGNSIDERLLKEIAVETGGRYFHAATADDLIEEFMNLTEDVIDFTTDSDGDGLADYYEKKLRYSNGIKVDTDPNNPDTDGDGLLDGEEIQIVAKEVERNGKKHMKISAKMTSHPKMKDTDRDGYDDYFEVKVQKKDDGGGEYDSLKWNVSDRDLAMAASISYSYIPKGTNFDNLSSDWKEKLNNGFSGVAYIEELRGWKVLDTWYRSGGLQAVALKKDDNIIMAYRGTEEPFKDWFNNTTTYILGISTQTPGAKKFMKNTMKNNKENKFYVTGHSLGGHLAYNAAAEGIHYDSSTINGIVTFNGLGLTTGLSLVGDIWDEWQLKKLESKIRNYTVKDDPVYNIVFTFHHGTEKLYLKSEQAPDEHSLYTFLEKLEPLNRTKP